jgi:hypothetical protein
MDVDSIQETAHSPYYGPWTPWTPWQTICQSGLTSWQTRTRTREVGETWSWRTHHENCDPLELPIAGTIWVTSVVDGPWQTASNTHPETQREYRTIVLAVAVSQLTPWKMAVLPTIHHGDRLHLDWAGLAEIPEVTAYRAALDGRPLEVDEYVLADDLAEGHHVVDLHLETTGGEQDYQVTFASAARFVAWFPQSVIELRLPKAGRPNGTKFAVTVANRSQDAVFVRPAVVGVPAGWKAVFLDETSAKIGAGRQRDFIMQVEAMTDTAIRRGPQPLAVEIRSIGREEGGEETACASCVLQVTGDSKTIDKIERLVVERNRRHRPLLNVDFVTARGAGRGRGRGHR